MNQMNVLSNEHGHSLRHHWINPLLITANETRSSTLNRAYSWSLVRKIEEDLKEGDFVWYRTSSDSSGQSSSSANPAAGSFLLAKEASKQSNQSQQLSKVPLHVSAAVPAAISQPAAAALESGAGSSCCVNTTVANRLSSFIDELHNNARNEKLEMTASPAVRLVQLLQGLEASPHYYHFMASYIRHGLLCHGTEAAANISRNDEIMACCSLDDHTSAGTVREHSTVLLPAAHHACADAVAHVRLQSMRCQQPQQTREPAAEEGGGAMIPSMTAHPVQTGSSITQGAVWRHADSIPTDAPVNSRTSASLQHSASRVGHLSPQRRHRLQQVLSCMDDWWRHNFAKTQQLHQISRSILACDGPLDTSLSHIIQNR